MNIFSRLMALEEQATAFGFQWENAQQIITQIKAEVSELTVPLQENRIAELQEELGDLLHAVFSLCIFCQLDPYDTLNQSLDKFNRRLTAVKRLAKDAGYTDLKGQPFSKLMQIWDQAKALVG